LFWLLAAEVTQLGRIKICAAAAVAECNGVRNDTKILVLHEKQNDKADFQSLGIGTLLLVVRDEKLSFNLQLTVELISSKLDL
jgi:hypothetical protein